MPRRNAPQRSDQGVGRWRVDSGADQHVEGFDAFLVERPAGPHPLASVTNGGRSERAGPGSWQVRSRRKGMCRPTAAEQQRIKQLERENRDLKEANEILKAARFSSRGNSTLATVDLSVHRPDACAKVPGRVDLPRAHRAGCGGRPTHISEMEKAAIVGRTHRCWAHRRARATVDTPEGMYGRRKMTAHLRRQGHQAAACTVDRLMGDEGLSGVVRGRKHRVHDPGGREVVEPRTCSTGTSPRTRRTASGSPTCNADVGITGPMPTLGICRQFLRWRRPTAVLRCKRSA